ncbi:MAG: hypothetical protein JSR45_15110 [Proteobacteria bacterium]|nr:hypothetical protein [Pseudomonadota bacterium]
MTEADRRLQAIFAADAPPARDPAFVFALLHRLERRRLHWEIAAQAALALVAGALLWGFWPEVSQVLIAATPTVAACAAALAAAAGLLFLGRMLDPLSHKG